MPSEPSDERAAAQAEGRAERERLVGRAGVVGAGTLASRVLGFGRDMVIAALFTRGQTDAFAVALTIPNTLRQLLAEGAVSSAVVPVLSERLAQLLQRFRERLPQRSGNGLAELVWPCCRAARARRSGHVR